MRTLRGLIRLLALSMVRAPKLLACHMKKPIQQRIYETMNSSSDNGEERDVLVKTLLEQQKQLEQRVDSLEKQLEMLEYATRMTSWDSYMIL